MFDEKVMFIGNSSRWSHSAADYLAGHFRHVEALFWDYGDESPTATYAWEGDRILTFKADLILPRAMLSRVKTIAINFHPTIPDFRGVGGYNYAIADRLPVFGATCHHIVEKIDFGPIIKVLRFPILPAESVGSLRDRTATYCLILFYEIVHLISSGQELPRAANEQWKLKLYTRKMLAQQKKRERLDSSLAPIPA